METIFDKLINSDPVEKNKLEKDYNDFLLAEFVIDKMEEENLSVRTLAKKANVSPTVIQKIRNEKTADKINYRTFLNVLNTLGYKVSVERM
jgi:ribosome-binding protein aMBF1 (putative translation factor)